MQPIERKTHTKKKKYIQSDRKRRTERWTVHRRISKMKEFGMQKLPSMFRYFCVTICEFGTIENARFSQLLKHVSWYTHYRLISAQIQNYIYYTLIRRIMKHLPLLEAVATHYTVILMRQYKLGLNWILTFATILAFQFISNVKRQSSLYLCLYIWMT